MRPHHSSVLMVIEKLCVEYGRRVHLFEASTMRFVAQHTTIPDPKVLFAFEHSGIVYIVMERINGDMLGKGWVKRSEKSKAKLLSQLTEMVNEMRQLQSPERTGIASIDGGSHYDCRVPGTSLRFGPFGTGQNFHKHLRTGMEFDPRLDTEAQDSFKQQDNTWPLSFTHGDLSSLDILARGDDIAGIIDWETAGWYPSYWEYTCAHLANPQNSFWVHEIDKFLQPMPEELAMEQTRQKYLGDV
ncbi:aminoglycoside phosphotransferase family protein [Aspergillus stella-maris]|uniref:aminoglycoside phosphotransferase family protein n=1 Tax=Aspergillus stella-maris TaxID=1810926 RepID=UPI003CCD37C0